MLCDKLITLIFCISDNSKKHKKQRATLTSSSSRRKSSGQQAVCSNKEEACNPSSSNAYLSDDSIGSASDLRATANDEEREGYESEGESEQDRRGKQLTSSRSSRRCSFNEQESVNTCGSSAYHAEYDSATTHDEDSRPKITGNRRRRDKAAHNSTVDCEEGSDLLFVGHQYGEKPLLADDELDSSEGGHSSGSQSPQLKSPNEALRRCWNDDSTIDVFALAPFPNRQVTHPSHGTRVEPIYEQETPCVKEGSLVDLGDPSEGLPFHGDQHVGAVSALKICASVQICDEMSRKPEDLFGSLPFNSTGVSENPFKVVNSGVKPYHFHAQPSSSKQHIEHLSNESSTINITGYKLPELRSLDSELRGVAGAFHTHSSTFPSSSFSAASASENKSKHVKPDLFGAIPFTCEMKMPSQSSCPSSLNLTLNSHDLKRSWPSSSVHQIKHQTKSVLQPHAELDSVQKETRKDWYDKEEKEGKYHLIDETKFPGKANILPVKNSLKTKVTSSTSSKRSKPSKKSTEKISGFQNMSFEDFSSDDPGEPSSDINKFEVLRNESARGVEVERRGSMKRRSNPFS